MSEPQFDPYYAWLGIPPQQKKHFYSLLGLQLWEGDPGVVEAAADRRTAHLQSVKNGPHGPIAERILNEVAQARSTLLSPEKKAAYDAKLRPILEAAANGPGAALQSAGGPALRPTKPTPVAPIKPTQVASAVPAAPLGANPPQGAASPGGSPFGGGVPLPARAVPVQAVPVQAVPVQPAAQPSLDADLGLPSFPSFGAPPPAAAAAVPGDEFGLSAASAAMGLPTLAPPPPPPQADRGGVPLWLVLVGGFLLIAAPVVGGVLWWNSLPKTGLLVLEIPAEGRNEVVVTVDEKPVVIPTDGVLELPLRPGLHRVSAVRPGYQDQGGQWKVEIGQRHAPIGPWQPQQAILLALGGAAVADVQLEVDGKSVPLAGLPVVEGALQAPLPAGRRKLKLLRAGHEPFELAFDLSGGQMRKVAPLWTTKLGPALDVLAKVDPAADALLSKWTRSPVGISCDKDENPALALPVKVEGSYDLQVDFTRSAGGNAVMVGLPVGPKACRLVLSGWMGEAAGLEEIEGRGARKNASTVEPHKFANDQPQKVEASVRLSGENARIYVRLNGDELIDWSGPIASLSAPDPKRESRPATPDGRPSLHAWSSVVTFHTVKLRPADEGTAAYTAGETASPAKPEGVPLAGPNPGTPSEGTPAAEPPPNAGPPTAPGLAPDSPEALAIVNRLAVKLPPVDAADRRTASPPVGPFSRAERTVSLPAAKAIVVGVDFTTTLRNTQKAYIVALNTLRPIYAGPDGYRGGRTTLGKFDDQDGTEQKTAVRVAAKSGYALAGFEVQSDVRIWGMKAVFARIADGGLDLRDCYVAPMFETVGRLPTNTVLTDGRPLVGLAAQGGNEVDNVALIAAALGDAPAVPLPDLEFTPAPPWTKPVDLLALVDLELDSPTPESWRREEQELVSRGEDWDFLTIRYDLPLDYDLHVELKRDKGDGKLHTRARSAGGGDFEMMLNGPKGNAFEWFRDGFAKYTAKSTRLMPELGVLYKIHYRIRKWGMRVYVDGKIAADHKGDYSLLKQHVEPQRGLALLPFSSVVRVSKIELRPPAEIADPNELVTPDPPVERIPMPDAALLAAADKKVRQEFKKGFAEAGAGGDAPLAAALIEHARKLDLPPEERAAALQAATESAAQAGSGLLARIAVDEAGGRFEGDVWPLKVKSLTTAVKRATNPSDLSLTLEEIGRLRGSVGAPEQLDEVEALLALAETGAKRMLGADAGKKLAQARKEVDLLKPLCEAAKKASEKLAAAAEPVDPQAARTAAAWKCLAQRDWAGGLPLFAKGDDAKLAAAAAALLASPDDRAAQLGLADALWAWKPLDGPSYPPAATQEAAREWYMKAGPEEPQWKKLQEAFAPEAFPKAAGSPPGFTVPLYGLGGYGSMGPTKIEGDVSPGKDVGAYATLKGETTILFPRLPVGAWVHEFTLRMPADSGGVQFFYSSFAEERTRFSTLWNPDSKGFGTLLWHDRPRIEWQGRFGWESAIGATRNFPPRKELKFTLYATPGCHYLYESGRPVSTNEGVAPSDFMFWITTGKNTVAEIGKFHFRPLTARDAALVAAPTTEPDSTSSVARRAVELNAGKLGLPDKPALGKGAPYLVNSTRAPMQWIAPGGFTQKSREKDNAIPCEVSIGKGFWIGRYETTQAEWTAVAGANPSRTSGSPFLPVDGVGWNDVVQYCAKLNVLEKGRIPPGYEYRLPTDAEWEYACRAGLDEPYSVDDLSVWSYRNCRGRMRQVGASKPNPWGLYDMHGNAAEWVLDGGEPYEGRESERKDPIRLDMDPEHRHRLRGGGSYAYDCKSPDWIAAFHFPATCNGFRICLGPAIPR